MLLVTFAVPHESRAFRRTDASRSVRVLHTGIGEAAASRTIRAALNEERPSAVISSGFAGGLDPQLRVGDLVVDPSISDPVLIECLPPGLRHGKIHTAAVPVDSVAAKANLYRQTGAIAVDMETRAIAEECATASVPFVVLRAISDAASDPIPVPLSVAWDFPAQRPRPFRLTAWLLTHPNRIPEFTRFLRKTNIAAHRLAQILPSVVAACSPG